MGDFGFKPLLRDVDEATQLQVSHPYSRMLEIDVSDSRQISPGVEVDSGAANKLLIFAGTIRFGQDAASGGDEIEDPANEINEETEVDDGERRTVQLELKDPNRPRDILTGSAAIASPGNIYLSGNHSGIDVLPDAFGVNTANAAVKEVDGDLWLFSDVVAELGSQMNRMAYQVNTLVSRKS
jgi:flagellin-like hook-associated protein FlgL